MCILTGVDLFSIGRSLWELVVSGVARSEVGIGRDG